MEVINNHNIIILKLEIEIENTGHKTNTYIVMEKKTSKCMVVDPAFNSEKILEQIKRINGELKLVIITHAHADHIAALADLVNGTDVKVCVHEQDYNGLFDKTINQEDIVKTKVKSVDKINIEKIKDKTKETLGDLSLEFIHAPGHTKGSMVIYLKEYNLLFSGDTVFENTYGRTDLTTGSHDDMKDSLDKLFDIFDNPLVLPGHGKEFFLRDSKRKIRLLFAYKG